jgi:hypothetical protein
MLRDLNRIWVRVGRVSRKRRYLAVFTATVLALAVPTAAQAAWRAFSDSSLWNVPASPSSISPTNPYASQFANSPSTQLELSGTPDNPTYSSPIYFAKEGDPTAPVDVTIPDWAPRGSIRWNGQPVPVPAGVTPAPASDGHLVVVSADRRTAWEFWRCTQAGASGYTTSIIVQFDLTGPGYSDRMSDSSARGSGAPLIATTLRADEALDGIHHALGITVPSVGNNPIYPPATHSDGGGPDGGLQYGMLFVLRPDYPVPAGASVGVRNLLTSLKTYGAYVTDQGADLVIDADSTHPDLWKEAGLSQQSLDVTGADFRPAHSGPYVPIAKQASRKTTRSAKRAVVLRANKRSLRVGRQLRLSGHIRGQFTAGAQVRLQVRTKGHWRRFRQKRVEANGTFASWPHLGRAAGVSRHGHRVLRLRERRLRAGIRVLKIRAVVRGVGRSRAIQIRVRRR